MWQMDLLNAVDHVIQHSLEVISIVEIIVCVLISLLVFYGITRQIDVARRCQYYVVHKSSKQRVEIEKERKRADWL
ncbi:unnamed protein product [Rotaria magnacalcarata]